MEKFRELYNRVFDYQNNLRNYSREACIELMAYCYGVEPHGNFGCTKTARVNATELRRFKLRHDSDV